MLDIFNDNAFGVTSLTDTVNKLAYVPGRIGELGLFQAAGVNTTSIAIEEKEGALVLVNRSARGGPGQTVAKNGRTMRNLTIPHFEINDAVYADEVQGVRAWGTESQLETVMARVAERMGQHSQSFAATEEYAFIGAVKGIITYADGGTTNLYTEFGVSAEADTDFDLDNASPTDGILRKKCAGVVRTMATNLGGLPFNHVHAFCGDNFFDLLLQHSEVRATYQGWSEAKILREGYISSNGKIYSAFEFGGIVFENYRGSVNGTSFVNTNECHMFPVGVPGLFREVFAPADYVETVNTMGQRLYAKQYPMPNGKGVNLDVQMNALSYCVRPKVLMKGTHS